MSDALSVRAAAREAPTARFIATRGRALSFAEVARLTEERMSSLGELGATAGSRRPFPFIAQHDLETLVTLLALFELGVPAMPLHARWSEAERQRAVGDRSEVPPHSSDSERILAVLHTSGSSGSSRGVLLSRRAFLASARASAQNLGFGQDDLWLLCLPLGHIAGLSILTRCLSARRALFLGEASELSSSCATLASLVPTQLYRLLEDQVPSPPSLRAVLVGGAALSRSLHQRALQAGYPVLATYGSTETCSQIATQRLGTRDPSHVGPPIATAQVRILAGHIQVRGPILASGFYPRGELPLDPDGWFSTSDRGELTPDGELRVLGRADTVIISGGENVFPDEVEAVLQTHPDVAAACVVGVPDDEFGQRVFALVVSHQEALPLDLDSHLRRHLAGFKCPRGYLQLPALPLGPTGKVDHQRALELAQRHRAASRRDE